MLRRAIAGGCRADAPPTSSSLGRASWRNTKPTCQSQCRLPEAQHQPVTYKSCALDRSPMLRQRASCDSETFVRISTAAAMSSAFSEHLAQPTQQHVYLSSVQVRPKRARAKAREHKKGSVLLRPWFPPSPVASPHSETAHNHSCVSFPVQRGTDAPFSPIF